MDRVLYLFFLVIGFTIAISSCEDSQYHKLRKERQLMEHKIAMKKLQDELDGKYDVIPIQEVHCVETDYEIDLKPNYIIVYSKNGNVDTIPYAIDRDCISPIEAFFERDNM